MQKFIEVKIQGAVAQSVSGADFPSRRRDIFTPQSESPTVHVAKPLPVLPLTKMEIKNRTIVFPKTRPGQSSGNIACLVNATSVVSHVQWFCLLYCMIGNLNLNALTLFLFF